MKWGFLGYGLIAPKVYESLKELENETLHAIASQSNASRLKSEFSSEIKVYDQYDALCADPEIDIIYIATTHNFHKEHALMALRAGKHVICEKPIGLNATEVQKMIDCARKHQVFLMEALWMAYLPAVRSCIETVKSRAIGDVKLITANFSFNSEYHEDRRWLNPQLAGGGLYDVGVYPLAFANLIMGSIPQISHAHAWMSNSGVDLSCAFQLDYQDGTSAQLQCGVQLDTEHTATIYGTKGKIVFPTFWKGQSYDIITESGVQKMDIPFRSTGYYHELQHAVDCISEGELESSIWGLDDSLSQARLLDRLLTSIGYGKNKM